MSACQFCNTSNVLEPIQLPSKTQARPGLFNWVTGILVVGWVGIVTLAFELTGPQNVTAVPTLEAFLKTLF